MEWFFIALTSFLSLLAPVGIALDYLIADTLRRGMAGVEELLVRVDNRPSWSLLEGDIQRVRIASRGLEPLPKVRLAEVELETDVIALNWAALQTNNLLALRRSLRLPLQGALRLVVTQEDVNRALASGEIKTQLQALFHRLLPSEVSSLQLKVVQLTFLPQNRVQVDLQLTQSSTGTTEVEPLHVAINTGLRVNQGRQLELVEPQASLNGRKISHRILATVVNLMGDRLDLRQLEPQGIIARLLQLEINPQNLQVAAFVRLEPIARIDDTP